MVFLHFTYSIHSGVHLGNNKCDCVPSVIASSSCLIFHQLFFLILHLEVQFFLLIFCAVIFYLLLRKNSVDHCYAAKNFIWSGEANLI